MISRHHMKRILLTHCLTTALHEGQGTFHSFELRMPPSAKP